MQLLAAADDTMPTKVTSQGRFCLQQDQDSHPADPVSKDQETAAGLISSRVLKQSCHSVQSRSEPLACSGSEQHGQQHPQHAGNCLFDSIRFSNVVEMSGIDPSSEGLELEIMSAKRIQSC